MLPQLLLVMGAMTMQATNAQGSTQECAPGCFSFWRGDGWCDIPCYNAACNFDNGDCPTPKVTDCAPQCPDSWRGDGTCDPTCNSAACNFDNNDCKSAPVTARPTTKAPGTPPTLSPTKKPFSFLPFLTRAPTFGDSPTTTKSPTTKRPTTRRPTSKPVGIVEDTKAPTPSEEGSPSRSPTNKPFSFPWPPRTTPSPSDPPSGETPTRSPTPKKTKPPSNSKAPTPEPTRKPTKFPTAPTSNPTPGTPKPTTPTDSPTTRSPTSPVSGPTTRSPTLKPTQKPTTKPTLRPSAKPTLKPTTKSPTTGKPTSPTTAAPTPTTPSKSPTKKPTTKSPTSPPAPASLYDIELVFISEPEPAVKAAFLSAQARWEKAVVSDIPSTYIYKTTDLCYDDPATKLAADKVVDDLMIFVDVPYIDGVDNILGSAGPCIATTTGGLYVRVGMMQFDSADMEAMLNDGTLESVVFHEMGHVIGIGTLWEYKSLLSGSAPLLYTGAGGIQGLLEIGGKGKPIVEEDGGEGTARGHWDEETYGDEIFTGYISGAAYFSEMSLKSVKDLGYSVDATQADPFTMPNLKGSSLRGAGHKKRRMVKDTINKPIKFRAATPYDTAAPTSAPEYENDEYEVYEPSDSDTDSNEDPTEEGQDPTEEGQEPTEEGQEYEYDENEYENDEEKEQDLQESGEEEDGLDV